MKEAPKKIFIDKEDNYGLILEAWNEERHTPNNNEIEYILKSKSDQEKKELLEALDILCDIVESNELANTSEFQELISKH